MEKNGYKGIIFLIFLLAIIIGGYFLMKKSINFNSNTKNIVKENNIVTENDNRIEKDKAYIYYANKDVITEELDIEYVDVILNFKGSEDIQEKLNNETNEFKKLLKKDSEEDSYNKLSYAKYKTHEDYTYKNYLSLVVDYFTFDRENLVSYIKTESYVFNKDTGEKYSDESLYKEYDTSLKEINKKIKSYLEGEQLLTEEIVIDIDATMNGNYALFVDKIGRLCVSLVVKNDQRDYNEVIVLS